MPIATRRGRSGGSLRSHGSAVFTFSVGEVLNYGAHGCDYEYAAGFEVTLQALPIRDTSPRRCADACTPSRRTARRSRSARSNEYGTEADLVWVNHGRVVSDYGGPTGSEDRQEPFGYLVLSMAGGSIQR